MSKPKKKRPLMQPFGYINLDSWIAYNADDNVILISDDRCPSCRKSDHPRLFVDLQMVSDPKSRAYRGLQVHLALSGLNVHKKAAKKLITRSRVDIYIQKDQAHALLTLLGKVCRELGLS